MQTQRRTIQPDISQAVRQGLLAANKFLPQWLLMDENGGTFSDEINTLPEFYPFSCAAELITTFGKAMAYNFRQESRSWTIVDWVDLSARPHPLLTHISDAGILIDYIPVGNSVPTIRDVERIVRNELPSIRIGEAFPGLTDTLPVVSEKMSPVLFLLGSHIESLEINDLTILFKALASRMKRRDRMVLNFDLLKSPSIIEKAYHDDKGIHTLFHKNALVRINREMKANFEIRQFEYWPIYDAVTGTCRKYLVSITEQVVKFPSYNFEVWFKPWETISIGMAQKYDDDRIGDLLRMSDLQIEKMLFDSSKHYTLAILKSV